MPGGKEKPGTSILDHVPVQNQGSAPWTRAIWVAWWPANISVIYKEETRWGFQWILDEESMPASHSPFSSVVTFPWKPTSALNSKFRECSWQYRLEKTRVSQSQLYLKIRMEQNVSRDKNIRHIRSMYTCKRMQRNSDVQKEIRTDPNKSDFPTWNSSEPVSVLRLKVSTMS